ncbi:Putative virB2-like protein [Candidatus Phycorickettsia trachydisci]|uniref:VirB2-like protein n=1 Tax=Candidatus Phycorickettsia trachydisci TaxID=2115978 RepID=A0A2P1P6Z0_9RICK|nr:TrbC/VirB2 family protein [Candidatus Phycorickettsia trachydisci]AVP87015.1 Putative virB2-like protein [Candidatus Phycorickettsia trachydisci]
MRYDYKGNLLLRVLLFVLLSFWIATSANAMGSTASDVIGNSLCVLIHNLTGATAKAIGVLGIIIVAIGIMTGKMKHWTALPTIIGIFVLFGSSTLITYMAGVDVSGCS